MEPKQHPVWKPFHERLKGKTGWTEDQIYELWEMFFNGMELQKQRMSKDASTAKRTPNEHYNAIAEKLKDKLIITEGRMALWSGGYGVSEYARYKGYTTLESTLLGGAFDRLFENHLKPHGVDWGVIAPLWNALSRKYVAMGKSAVAVFIRIHEPNSVLLREEMPQIAGNHNFIMNTLQDLENLEMKGLEWHVVFGEGPKESLRELNNKQQLVTNHAFDTLLRAREILKLYLVSKSPAIDITTHQHKQLEIDNEKYLKQLKAWEDAGKPQGKKPKMPEAPTWNRAAAGMKTD